MEKARRDRYIDAYLTACCRWRDLRVFACDGDDGGVGLQRKALC